jgi:outer membrane receptor for ferrienterochelin and colicin
MRNASLFRWSLLVVFSALISVQVAQAQPEYRKRKQKKNQTEDKTPPPPPVYKPAPPVKQPTQDKPEAPPAPTYYYISGKVIDFDTRQPKEGVVINVVGKGISTRTDKNGRFELKLTQNQNVQLSANLYRYKGKTVNAVPGDDDLIIALRKESNLTAEIEKKDISTTTAAPVVATGDLDFSSLLDVKISTASKSAERINDAPGVVTTISQEEIERLGANTLADVLQRATGVFIAGSSLFTQNAVSIRGDILTHINNHVLILLDGRPVREGIFGGLDMAILASFPLKEIQQIEVIRGPGSVLYGTNAYSGVINIITKTGTEQAKIKGTIGGGTLGARMASVSGGGSVDSLKIHAGIQYYQDDGWELTAYDEVPATGPRANQLLQKTIRVPRANFGARVGGKYKEFTFNTIFAHTTYTTMGSSPNWSVYPNGDQVRSNRFFGDLGYEKRVTENVSLEVNATVNSFNAGFNLPGAPVAPFREYALDLLLEPTVHINLFSKKANIIVGGVIWNLNGEAKTRGAVTIPEFSDIWTSGYTQVSYQPFRQIKIIGGLQVNKATNQKLNLTPRAGLIFNPLPRLGLKLLYGEAFRAAFRGETSINTPVLRGSNLNAERIATYDAQIFYDFKKIQLSVTYFRSRQQELITRRPTVEAANINTYFNADRLEFQGGEFELKATPFPSLLFTGSLSYQENILKITFAGQNKEVKDFTTMPNLMYKLSLIYNFKRYGSLGVYWQTTGATDNAPIFDPYRDQFVPIRNINPQAKAFNFVTMNVNVNLLKIIKPDATQDLNLQFFVYNLLNESAYIPEFNRRFINTIPGLQSRTFYLNLTYQF